MAVGSCCSVTSGADDDPVRKFSKTSPNEFESYGCVVACPTHQTVAWNRLEIYWVPPLTEILVEYGIEVYLVKC